MKTEKHRSPSNDQIPAEPIKAGGRIFRYETNNLIIFIRNKEELPEEWKVSIIILSTEGRYDRL